MKRVIKKNLKFVNFNSDFYDVINNVFKKYIEPLYGDQTSAIKKIVNGTDRNCELLFSNNMLVGFLIYKTLLQNEFGLKNVFELKTVFVFEPYKNMGFGTILFNRAEELAVQYHAKCLYTSASKKIPDVIQFMKKNKWMIMEEDKSNDNSVDVFIMAKWL